MEKSFVNQFSPDLSLLVRGAKLQGWGFSELLGRDLSGANTGTRILFCNELLFIDKLNITLPIIYALWQCFLNFFPPNVISPPAT